MQNQISVVENNLRRHVCNSCSKLKAEFIIFIKLFFNFFKIQNKIKVNFVFCGVKGHLGGGLVLKTPLKLQFVQFVQFVRRLSSSSMIKFFIISVINLQILCNLMTHFDVSKFQHIKVKSKISSFCDNLS